LAGLFDVGGVDASGARVRDDNNGEMDGKADWAAVNPLNGVSQSSDDDVERNWLRVKHRISKQVSVF
jgi:hypothetical protein